MSDFQKSISVLRSQGFGVTIRNFERVQVARIEGNDFRGGLISKPDKYNSEVEGLHHATILISDMKYKLANKENQISFGEQDIEELEKLISTVYDLKFVERDYGILINENADLDNFNQLAKKYLSTEQLEEIQEELENIPETYY